MAKALLPLKKGGREGFLKRPFVNRESDARKEILLYDFEKGTIKFIRGGKYPFCHWDFLISERMMIAKHLSRLLNQGRILKEGDFFVFGR